MQVKYFVSIFCLNWLISDHQPQQKEYGKASYYADKLAGKPTASGQLYDPKKLTGAHKKLPFGTEVKVTNVKNDRVVQVIINDRGPFVRDRVIDLSRAAAEEIDMIRAGTAQVMVEVVEKE